MKINNFHNSLKKKVCFRENRQIVDKFELRYSILRIPFYLLQNTLDQLAPRNTNAGKKVQR